MSKRSILYGTVDDYFAVMVVADPDGASVIAAPYGQDAKRLVTNLDGLATQTTALTSALQSLLADPQSQQARAEAQAALAKIETTIIKCDAFDIQSGKMH